MKEKLKAAFVQQYNTEPMIVRSPGRVNIIGEHTDYNDGFVLPAAIDKSIYAAVSKRHDFKLGLYALNYNETIECNMEDIRPSKSWSTYIMGVTDQLLKKGCRISGFNIAVDGDVPLGAGLSSSAALECSVVFALNELFSLGLSKMDMILIAQRAEHAFAGVNCGIMDMFASMHGREGHVMKLDCRSLEHEYVPLKMDDYSLVLFNTNIQHALASTAYNERRQQCEQGVAWIRERWPAVNSLRDADVSMLRTAVKKQDELVYRRCLYVVQEIQRLEEACEDLKAGNLQALGQKMYLTHRGLSKDYEVSCKELDLLVDSVIGHQEVLGARMMGGGFGGCTINIIRNDAVERLSNETAAVYKKLTGIDMSTIVVKTSGGTEKLSA